MLLSIMFAQITIAVGIVGAVLCFAIYFWSDQQERQHEQDGEHGSDHHH
jgi:mannose/fructose/N-acetylgalactosamine-specific phosphotransferase system component IIC